MVNQMVLSREIEWIGYDHKRKMLQVEFIEGRIYQYDDVPESVYEQFLGAASHGTYFEESVKPNYLHRRVK